MFPFSVTAPGETMEIAEEMAARDTLQNMMGTSLHRSPLPICDKVTVDYNSVNQTLPISYYRRCVDSNK